MPESLRHRLEHASAGLVYSSESDRPFSVVTLGAVGPVRALTPQRVAELLGLPGAPAEEWPADRFLAHHLSVDARDRASVALVPRYDALARTLAEMLPGWRLFRVGRIEVQVLALGDDLQTGEVAGLHTVAVET